MTPASAKHIGIVVQQHAEESAHLRNMRSVLATAPHVKLSHLRRLDDRLAAHLDGLAVAGEFGSNLCEAALENPGIGEVFAAAVRAIEEKEERRLDKLFSLVGAMPEAQPDQGRQLGLHHFFQGQMPRMPTHHRSTCP